MIQNSTTPATARAFFAFFIQASRGIISPFIGPMQIHTDHKLSDTARFCSVWNLLMGGAGGLIDGMADGVYTMSLIQKTLPKIR